MSSKLAPTGLKSFKNSKDSNQSSISKSKSKRKGKIKGDKKLPKNIATNDQDEIITSKEYILEKT